jgi:UDP-glucose 4-epimerase
MKEGHEVIALDNETNGNWDNLKQWHQNPRFKKVHQDILEIQSDDENFRGLDYVFHLAGIESPITSLKSPEIFYSTNVHGTVKVLQAARQSELKNFLYAGSSAVYGDASTPTLETDAVGPMTPSCLTKLQAEEAVFHWGDVFGFPTNSLRIFNSYGPRDHAKIYPNSVFSIWMQQKANDQPLTIVGDGSHARDFIYCTDVANAFWVTAKEGKNGEIYNIGSGKATTLNEITDCIKGKKAFIKNLKDEPNKTWADISKIQFDCNWQPRIPLESGVEFSLDVLEDWASDPLWDQEKLSYYFETWFEVYS